MNSKTIEFWTIVFLGLYAVLGLNGWSLNPIIQYLFR